MAQEANSTSRNSFKKLDPSSNGSKPRNTPKVPKKITESYLSNSGAYYLERFSASAEQFRRVMTRKINKSCKAHPDQVPEQCFEMLEKTIVKFHDLGYLNDKIYASSLVNSLRNKGWPKNRIAMRLREKCVDGELIDNLLSDTQPDDDYQRAIIWIKRKRLGPFATKEKTHDKNLAAMGRAGFDYNTASRALSLSKEEIEDIIIGS